MTMRLLHTLTPALLAGISIAYAPLWFFSIPALAWFFFALWYKTDTVLNASIAGYVFGFATVGASIWWVWDTLPLTWLALDSTLLQWTVVFMTWGYVAATLAMVSALFAAGIWKLRGIPYALSYITSIGWVLQDIGREWFFYIVTYAPQSLPGAHFSISALGYTLAENHYLLQLAEGFGVYGLTAVVALTAATAACIAHAVLYKKNYIQAAILSCITIGMLLIPSLHPYTQVTSENTLRVAMISADLPVHDNTTATNTYWGLLEEIATYTDQPDLVAFPEGNGVADRYPDATERHEALQALFPNKDVLVVSSYYTQDTQGQMHSLLYYDSSARGTIATYEKMFLMAQGEYAPLVSRPLFSILNNTTVREHLETLGMNLQRGDTVVSTSFKGVTIGSLLCAETLSPVLYTELVRDAGAQLLLNLSHTSWFNGSPTLFSKMLQMARVHAVQHRVPFVQASNGFPSFMLTPSGETVVMSKKGETGVYVVEIPIPNR